MSMARRCVRLGVHAALALSASRLAEAQPARARGSIPNGAALVRLLGPRAADAVSVPGASSSRGIGARVILPQGMRASELGLTELTPGFARFTATPAALIAFADAHPGLE